MLRIVGDKVDGGEISHPPPFRPPPTRCDADILIPKTLGWIQPLKEISGFENTKSVDLEQTRRLPESGFKIAASSRVLIITVVSQVSMHVLPQSMFGTFWRPHYFCLIIFPCEKKLGADPN